MWWINELKFKFLDRWSTALFIDFVRSGKIEPFRSKGQRKTTVTIPLSEKNWEPYAVEWESLLKRLYGGFFEVIEELKSEMTVKSKETGMTVVIRPLKIERIIRNLS